jgi:hypothetical protein
MWKFLVIGVLVIAGVVLLSGVIHFLVGIVWFFIKLIVIVAILYFVARWLFRKVEHEVQHKS